MKRKSKGGLILVLSMVLLVFGTMGVLAFSDNNSLQLKIDPRGTPIFDDNRTIDGFKLDNQGEVLFEAADLQEINVLYPIEGFYYITDYLELLIETNNIANCQYSFEGSEFESMEYTNDTFHYHYLYDIEDNMNSTEPYEIDFRCVEESEQDYNASTYFWINTSELDKYFLRYDIEDWSYLFSDISWSGNENGLLEIYRGLYNKTDEIYNRISVFVFDDFSSIQGFVDFEIFGAFENVSVVSVNGYNVYVFEDDSGSKYLAWTSGRYLISSNLFVFGNLTSVELNLSSDLIDSYFEKYPGDLKYGICGDGEINILNLDGFNEECDGNIETESCGSDVGECSIGEIMRECNNDCMWGTWGECTAIGPEEEICDELDNDCDGSVDEQLVCVEPIELSVNSPSQNLFGDRRIPFNLTTNEIVDKITYIDNSDSRSREKSLCTRNCNGYGNDRAKLQSFSDGYHNLTFYAIKDGEVVDVENTDFLVDSKKPRISKTEPRRNSFTNGSEFYIKYTEDNVQNIVLKFSPVCYGSGCGVRAPVNLSNCPSGRNVECSVDVNHLGFDGENLEYWFEITDIIGNKEISKPIMVKVDTTSPVLNNPESFWKQGEGRYYKYIYFTFNVTEQNFDEINYIDLSESRPRETRLCSRLRDGICEVKKSFRTGEHNLTINLLDNAGNSIEEMFSFSV